MATKQKAGKKSKTKVKKTTKTGKTVKTVAFNISVPTSFLKKIDAGAKKAQLPRSAYVRQQLQASL